MTILSSCAYRGRASPTKWDVISRDNVSVKVSAVIYFRVVDAERAIIQVSNYLAATSPTRTDHAALGPGQARPRPDAGPRTNYQQRPARRIAVLHTGGEDDPEVTAQLESFRAALASLGWVEGRTLHIDSSRKSWLRSNLTQSSHRVRPEHAAVQRETRVIPIVFVGVSDPIGSGFVENLAQPGGNLTGLMQYEEGIAGKWLAMLKEIAPHLTRIALLVANPTTGPYGYFVQTAETAAAPLAIKIFPTPITTAIDIVRSIESFSIRH